MKKTFSFIFLFYFLFFSHSIFASNLISSNVYSSSEVQNIDINLTYEEINFSTIYGDELVIDVYANNNHLLPLLEVIKDEEGRGTLKVYTSTKGYSATKGDVCRIDVFFPKKNNFKNIKIASLSPSFLIEEVNAKNIYILDKGKTKSDININNCSFSLIKVVTTSSNINISNTTSEYINTLSENGNITFKNILSDYFDIKTNTGFVSLSLKTPPYASSNIVTKSGNIELYVPSNSDGFNLSVFSSTGSVNDKIKKKRVNPRLGYNQTYKDGGALIYITTESGNTEISSF